MKACLFRHHPCTDLYIPLSMHSIVDEKSNQHLNATSHNICESAIRNGFSLYLFYPALHNLSSINVWSLITLFFRFYRNMCSFTIEMQQV